MNWQAFLCASVIWFSLSCNKTGPEPPREQLIINPGSLTLAATKNANADFILDANMMWAITVSPAAPWMKTSITEGFAGVHEIRVTALEDNSGAERTAILTISPAGGARGEPKSITVTQQSKAGAFAVDKTELLIAGIENELDSFRITSNMSWTVTTNATWLTIGTANGSNNAKIEVTNTSDNLLGTELTGTITITPNVAGIAPHVINVKQGGWSRAFGGASFDEITASAKAVDGGVVLAGITESAQDELAANHGKGDFWLIRTNASGKKVWQKVFGGSNTDKANAVAIATDGGFVAAGVTRSNDGDVTNAKGNEDIWVIKTDVNGTLLWQKTFGGSGWDKASHILATPDGGFVLTGETSSTDGDFLNAGNKNLFIMKLTSSGSLSWVKNYGGANTETGTNVIATTDGNYLVSASTSSIDGDVVGNTSTVAKAWYLKVSADGSLIWQAIVNHTHFAIPNAAVVSGTGFIICGKRQEATMITELSQNDENVFVTRLEADGSVSWTKTFGGSHFDNASAIIPAHGGGFIMTGYTRSNNGDVSGNHGDHDIWLLKIDESGHKGWQKALGGNRYENGVGILQAPNNAYWIAGNTNSDGLNHSAALDYSGLLMKVKE